MTEHIVFMRGDVVQTYTILIEDDEECEIDPNEQFLSDMALVSGIPDINVTVPQALITIDDRDESECGKEFMYTLMIKIVQASSFRFNYCWL